MMNTMQRTTPVGRGIFGSSSNPGRRYTRNKFVAEAHSQFSRLPRVGLFVKREGRFRGPQEETIVTPNHDLSEMHGDFEYAATTTEVSVLSKKEGPRLAPILLGPLIATSLLLNAKFLPGAPTTFPTTHKSQTLVSILAYTSSIVSLFGAANLLPALRIAREQIPQQQEVDKKKVFGAALLVAGGTVGAGIVALPVKTASVGLLPSAAGLIGGWAYMLLTAFLIVEVSEHCGAGANFTTMADMTLGKRWKAVSAALYIFVYCATLTAYIAESATFIGPPLAMALGHALPTATLSVVFTAVFGGVIAMGSKAVDTVNSTCVLVALAAFALLMGIGGTSLSSASLMFCNWPGAVQTMPIMIVAFTFHNMIPSLFGYLKSAAAVRKALFIGTLIPLSMYLMWEVLILGSLPAGSSLASVGEVVKMMGSTGAVPAAISVFSLFAIITSFLGVGMGCIDFVKDLAGGQNEGVKEEGGKGPATGLAVAVTMFPPLAIACLCPKLFVAALELSGMLRLVLFAIIPALMLRAGPLRKSGAGKEWVAGAVALIAAAIIGIDVVGRLAPVTV
ncbi:hypothetical protein BSKO_11394 [Bryopsis sp. KO-2023]|nr:hypothetical protein BSKO_11394 [Bryopsis sp. KO-2023]